MTIFMDSFQYATAEIPRKWANLGGLGASLSNIDVATELYGRKLEVFSAGAVLEKYLGASATWSLSFPYMIKSVQSQTNPNESRDVILFRDAGTVQVSIFIERGRILTIKRGTVVHNNSGSDTTGGTALTGGVSAIALDPDVWYQIEIKATFSASLSANAFQVRITGPAIEETLTLAAGQSTLTTANAWSDRILIRGAAASSNARGPEYGAMYIDSGQAALLGNVRVSPLTVNANGNSSQWVGSDSNSVDNYLLVDDATPDDDTTHVATSTDAQIDLYGATNFPTPAVEVLAVQFNAQARKTDAADAYIEPAYRISATNYFDSPIMVGNAYHNIGAALALSPATSTAWTQAEIEAMEVGFRSSL